MSLQRKFPDLRKQVQGGYSYIPPISVLSAVAVIALGAGFIAALPEGSGNGAAVTTAAAPVSETALDESLCEKQAWPYIDQRCAQRVEKARGTRQVRIVTDKGNSVTVMTPVPIVEAKPKSPPPAPVIAQAGLPAAPMAAQPVPPAEKLAAAPPLPAPAAPAPAVQPSAAPANPPAASEAMARDNADPVAGLQRAATTPIAATIAPSAETVHDMRVKNLKSARAEKAERREARRRKALEQDAGVPEEVVAAVRALPAGGQNGRRARNAVPDEVLAAVEEAAAGRGRQVVTVGSADGGRRMYLVPREPGGW